MVLLLWKLFLSWHIFSSLFFHFHSANKAFVNKHMAKHGTEHRVQPYMLMLERKITCKRLLSKCKWFRLFNHGRWYKHCSPVALSWIPRVWTWFAVCGYSLWVSHCDGAACVVLGSVSWEEKQIESEKFTFCCIWSWFHKVQLNRHPTRRGTK